MKLLLGAATAVVLIGLSPLMTTKKTGRVIYLDGLPAAGKTNF
jgi:hypothetical protein